MRLQPIRTTVLIIIVLLVGCAEEDRMIVPDAKYAGMQKIAVASVLGTHFHGTYIGITIFNNQEYVAEVPQWDIDGKAINAAISALSVDTSKLATSIGSSFAPTAIGQMIDAAKARGADTLVVILPSGYDNEPHFVGGYGYYKQSALGLSRTCMYSLFVVQVYSVASSKRQGWNWSFPDMPVLKGIPCYGGDQQVVWKENFSQYSSPELAVIEAAIETSVTVNVKTALSQLGMIPSEPPGQLRPLPHR